MRSINSCDCLRRFLAMFSTPFGRLLTTRSKVANLRFAFEALTRAFRSRVSLKPQGEGWEAFRRALRLRHRLTHPKRADQLSIGDDELHDLVKAHGWFSTTFEAILRTLGWRDLAGDIPWPP